MKKIVVVALVVIGAFYLLSQSNLPILKRESKNVNQYGRHEIVTNAAYEMIKGFCSMNNSRINIKDENNHYVNEVKQVIFSNTKLSEKYFNEHFKFMCGIDAPFVRAVHFVYTIGEYSASVDISPPNPEANINSYVYNFEGAVEIKYVISKQQAIESMDKCIGNDWGTTYQPISFGSKGLYFTATNYDRKLIGQLNLETGQCTTSNWSPFRD